MRGKDYRYRERASDREKERELGANIPLEELELQLQFTPLTGDEFAKRVVADRTRDSERDGREREKLVILGGFSLLSTCAMSE